MTTPGLLQDVGNAVDFDKQNELANLDTLVVTLLLTRRSSDAIELKALAPTNPRVAIGVGGSAADFRDKTAYPTVTIGAIASPEGEATAFRLDVNADGQISPLDALVVINQLSRPASEAEFFRELGLGLESIAGEETLVTRLIGR